MSKKEPLGSVRGLDVKFYYMEPPRTLFKRQIPGFHMADSGSVDLGWGPEILIFNNHRLVILMGAFRDQTWRRRLPPHLLSSSPPPLSLSLLSFLSLHPHAHAYTYRHKGWLCPGGSLELLIPLFPTLPWLVDKYLSPSHANDHI